MYYIPNEFSNGAQKKIGMRSPSSRQEMAENSSNMPIFGNRVSQSESVVNKIFMDSSEKHFDTLHKKRREQQMFATFLVRTVGLEPTRESIGS